MFPNGLFGPKRVPELQAVIPGRRLGEDGEVAVAPVEVARVDDDAADRGAVAADPLRGRVDHDVRAVLDRPAEVAARAERVVDDQRDAVPVRDVREGFDSRAR